MIGILCSNQGYVSDTKVTSIMVELEAFNSFSAVRRQSKYGEHLWYRFLATVSFPPSPSSQSSYVVAVI